MSEFIVWDDGCFINEDDFAICSNGELITWSCYGDLESTSGKKYFIYVGIKDIDGKKIYADCSVVEFDHELIDAYDTFVIKRKGYFTMNYNFLAYEIDGITYALNEHKISNLKVIGTLQENPELLGAVK